MLFSGSPDGEHTLVPSIVEGLRKDRELELDIVCNGELPHLTLCLFI